ncbi:unnamed protein product [Closterium sp. Naga37s-1]|nr:unnamed protein product [Closterium sp. Naga37s-1]
MGQSQLRSVVGQPQVHTVASSVHHSPPILQPPHWSLSLGHPSTNHPPGVHGAANSVHQSVLSFVPWRATTAIGSASCAHPFDVMVEAAPLSHHSQVLCVCSIATSQVLCVCSIATSQVLCVCSIATSVDADVGPLVVFKRD